MGIYHNSGDRDLVCFVCDEPIECSSIYWSGGAVYELALTGRSDTPDVKYVASFDDDRAITIHLHPACVYDMCVPMLTDAKDHTVFVSDRD